MKCLERNKQAFYYALYEGKTEVEDARGNPTGSYELHFGNPVLSAGNISAAKGETASMQFGESEDYDRVIVLDNPVTPIDEYSILWIDTTPVITNGETETPHDYIVRKVARSLNSVSIAVSKVDVS